MSKLTLLLAFSLLTHILNPLHATDMSRRQARQCLQFLSTFCQKCKYVGFNHSIWNDHEIMLSNKYQHA